MEQVLLKCRCEQFIPNLVGLTYEALTCPKLSLEDREQVLLSRMSDTPAGIVASKRISEALTDSCIDDARSRIPRQFRSTSLLLRDRPSITPAPMLLIDEGADDHVIIQQGTSYRKMSRPQYGPPFTNGFK